MKKPSPESTGVRRPPRPTQQLLNKKMGRLHWFRIWLVGLFITACGAAVGLFIMHHTENAARIRIEAETKRALSILRQNNSHGNREVASAHLVTFLKTQLAKPIDAVTLSPNERRFLDEMHAISPTAWQEISRDLSLLDGPPLDLEQRVIIFSMPLWTDGMEQRAVIYQESRKLLFQIRAKEDAQALIFQGLSNRYKDFSSEMREQHDLWKSAMAAPIDFAQKSIEIPLIGGDHRALQKATVQSFQMLDEAVTPPVNAILNTLWEIRGRLLLRFAQQQLQSPRVRTVLVICDEPTSLILSHAAYLHGINLDLMKISDPRA